MVAARTNSRRFLFHTAFPSGGGRPFGAADDLEASRKLLAVLATSRGFGVEEVLGGATVGDAVARGFSPILGETLAEVPFEAKKVLLTETDLKVVGFLTEDDLTWLLSSFLDLEASVSEPLTLTSVELATSSTSSLTSLSTTTLPEESPFSSGAGRGSREVWSTS